MSNHEQFAEIIAGHFYDVLRAAGVSMSPVNAHEKIRAVSKKLALSIEHRAEQKSIEVIKRLQSAVKASFDLMERDFIDQKERIDRLEQIVILQRKLMETDLGLSPRAGSDYPPQARDTSNGFYGVKDESSS